MPKVRLELRTGTKKRKEGFLAKDNHFADIFSTHHIAKCGTSVLEALYRSLSILQLSLHVPLDQLAKARCVMLHVLEEEKSFSSNVQRRHVLYKGQFIV